MTVAGPMAGSPELRNLQLADGERVPGIDLDAWRGDLQRLHSTLDQVVQSFISSQTRQLDAIAMELSVQKERIVAKERCFTELSDSIAGFVEDETKRLQAWGTSLGDIEADEEREAYDAELPGLPALHRINRLWRKTTRAFDAVRKAKEQEATAAMEDHRKRLEAVVAEAKEYCAEQQRAHSAEVAALQAQLQELRGDGEQWEAASGRLSEEATSLAEQLAASKVELAQLAKSLEQAEASRSRAAYEWEAEREELSRNHTAAEQRSGELEAALGQAVAREQELGRKHAERGNKLEQMRRVMDEQERDMTQKIERVEQYVKERQAGALHAERKQQDAEKMAERWQGEVRRLQAEKDKLALLVLDLEGRQSGQAIEFRTAFEKHQQEVSALEDALKKKEEEMRSANLELLRQRDDEYNAKVISERQREKDRSVALLKKKEQELHIRDQQLKAARQRIEELERASTGGSLCPQSSSPRSRGSSAVARRQLSGEGCLPPLPLSAR
mmetsp:Transcript_57990/g.135090  ORF Transcript_57990/g.135090 Transcript_57990/m.135090 type:complete len:501 (-) Transcript_57990:152-1654(-)